MNNALEFIKNSPSAANHRYTVKQKVHLTPIILGVLGLAILVGVCTAKGITGRFTNLSAKDIAIVVGSGAVSVLAAVGLIVHGCLFRKACVYKDSKHVYTFFGDPDIHQVLLRARKSADQEFLKFLANDVYSHHSDYSNKTLLKIALKHPDIVKVDSWKF